MQRLFFDETGVAPQTVSILIQPEGRMQLHRYLSICFGFVKVSILIQPEGRMQPPQGVCGRRHGSGFNPHPARRPDATLISRGEDGRYPVSILIQPEGRMQLPKGTGQHPLLAVSILIQPEGRMQQAHV